MKMKKYIFLILIILFSALLLFSNKKISLDSFEKSYFEDGSILYSKFLKEDENERILVSYSGNELRVNIYDLINNIATNKLIATNIDESQAEEYLNTFSHDGYRKFDDPNATIVNFNEKE